MLDPDRKTGFAEMWNRKRIEENPIEYKTLDALRYRSFKVVKGVIGVRYAAGYYDVHNIY